MWPMLRALIACASLQLIPAMAQARVWYIKPDRTGDAPTIQAGLDSAHAGDRVVLARGVYTWASQDARGDCMMRLKPDVALEGEGFLLDTVVDAQQQGRVLMFSEPGNATVTGLAIRGGRVVGANARGGGVLSMKGANLTLTTCFIAGNRVEASGTAMGGAVYLEGGSIVGCYITGNVAIGDSAMGGGVYCWGSTVSGRTVVIENTCRSTGRASLGGGICAAGGGTISGSVIHENVGTGGQSVKGGGVYVLGGVIEQCWVSRNRGAHGSGIYCSDADILESVLMENTAGSAGGVIASASRDLPSRIQNCTVIANTTELVGGGTAAIALESGGTVSNTIVVSNDEAACSGAITATCCDFYDNAGGNTLCGADGGGNFSADPLFCVLDPVGRANVDIRSDSPCAPGNHPDGAECGLIGAAEVRCITAVEPRSWTQVKNLYR